jgi:hypothetical protein
VLLEWEIDFSLLLVAVCSGMLSRAVLRALVLGMVLTRALGLGRKAGGVHHARFTSGSFAAHVLPDWSVVPLEGQCSEAPLATGVLPRITTAMPGVIRCCSA